VAGVGPLPIGYRRISPFADLGHALRCRRCPRHESNMRTRFRKPLLYPLSYGGATQKGIAAAVQSRSGPQLGGRIAGVSLNEWNRSCMKCAAAIIRRS
jgi:hypothetical protein